MNVVNTPPLPTSGFRLFYDEVVADVRAALRERLGKEKVPIADVQREVARLWKECSNQEEYRQKAALLRESRGTTESSKPLDTDELVIPPHRLRRIIELDDNGPRVSKGALKVLGQATTIFLSQFAGNIHRQIVDTEGSYPVKPVHVWNVIRNPLHLKYKFLESSGKQLGSTPSESNDTEVTIASTDDVKMVYRNSGDAKDVPLVSTEGVTRTPGASVVTKQSEPGEPTKKRSLSILSYFSNIKRS